MRRSLCFSLLLLIIGSNAYSADVTGEWKGSVSLSNGKEDQIITLKSNGDKLTGDLVVVPQRAIPIEKGVVSDDSISFFVFRDFGDTQMKVEYRGEVAFGPDGKPALITFAVRVTERTLGGKWMSLPFSMYMQRTTFERSSK
jgi:hypothetical protein